MLDSLKVFLVDVRLPEERAVSYIAQAMTIEQLEAVPAERYQGASVVTYCVSGKRGAMNAHRLAAEHPGLNVMTLIGGIALWVHAGLSVVDPEGNIVMSLHSGPMKKAIGPLYPTEYTMVMG